MARHVPVTRELHLPGRRDLLDAGTVKDSLNALPGFKTSAGELHVQAHFPFADISAFSAFSSFGVCVLCEEGRRATIYKFCKLYWRCLLLFASYVLDLVRVYGYYAFAMNAAEQSYFGNCLSCIRLLQN
jgi:hypothetical protein